MTMRLFHPALLFATRALLGMVFLWAAWSKITDVPSFAANIKNYGMLPLDLLPAFAMALAGLEVAVGLALVAGVWRKGATLLCTGMLVMFIVALTYAYASGRSIHCGCFTADLDPAKASDIRGEMLQRIVEDIGLLLLSLHALWGALRDAAPTPSRKS